MKRLLCLLLALLAALAAGTASAGAASSGNGSVAVQLNRGGEAELVDGDGVAVASSGPASCDAGNYTFEVAPGQTVYLCLGESGSADTTALWDVSAEAMGAAATADELADSGLFRLKADKSGPGGSLLKIKQYGEKSLGDGPRSSWLRILARRA